MRHSRPAMDARAAQVALVSEPVRRACRIIARAVRSLRDPRVREHVRDLLRYPHPTALSRSWAASQVRSRWRRLVAAGLCVPAARTETDFLALYQPRAMPPEADVAYSTGGVAFGPELLAAPGAHASHHVYPGGLVLHTALNLQAALAIRAAIGAAGAATVALDDIIAAQVLHDVMKAHLLRWRPDGHPSTEPRVATTWLHHILILAEGLLRRFPARALLAIASVHADPSVDPRKVAGFLHAAALVAGLDPGSTQLLRAIGASGAARGPGTWVLALRPSTTDWIARAAEEVWRTPSIATLRQVRRALRAAARQGDLGPDWPSPGTSAERWAQNFVLTMRTEFTLAAALPGTRGKFAEHVRGATEDLQAQRLWPRQRSSDLRPRTSR